MKVFDASTRPPGRTVRKGGKPQKRDTRFAGRHSDPTFRGGAAQHQAHRNPKRTGATHRFPLSEDPRFRQSRIDARGRPRKDALPQRDVDAGELEEEDEDDDAEEPEQEEVEEEEEEEDLDEEDAIDVQSACEEIESTRRIAVVKCDWDHIGAADLFAVFLHNLPPGGRLLEVCIYRSEIGKKMLDHERVHDPDLWVRERDAEFNAVEAQNTALRRERAELAAQLHADKELLGNPDAHDDEDEWEDDDMGMLDEDGEEGEKFSGGKYRQYEMNRLKTHYAIATFDSRETAAEIYRICDGVDVEASGVVLDLRYVDDGESFDDDPVSRVTALPSDHKPLKAFKNAALSQCRFQISWDQDNPARSRRLRNAFDDPNEDAEADLRAYIASDESEDEKVEEIRERYRALLGEINADEDEDVVPDEGKEDEGEGGEEDEAPSLGDEEGEVEGNLEATIDLDAGEKAKGLQHAVARSVALAGQSLGEHLERKQREKRKEGRKLKHAERVTEVAQTKPFQSAEEEMPKISGKARRKIRVREAKMRAAELRMQAKKQRTVLQLGGKLDEKPPVQPKDTAESSAVVDKRFDKRLMTDPRFHLDVEKKTRRESVLQSAAKAIAAARRTRKPEVEEDPTGNLISQFLEPPRKAARKERR